MARFTDPYGDHPPYSRFQFDVDPGNTRVIYGSSLDIHASVIGADAELDNVTLVLAGGSGAADESLPMFPEGGGAWRATVANVTTPTRYYIRSGSARTEHYRVDIITVPHIEAVRFRVTPPAYTNRPPIDGPLPQGGLSGLPGTVVQVWARSNRPLRGGTLQLDAPHGTLAGPTTIPATQPSQASNLELQPVAAGANEVTSTFVIRAGEAESDRHRYGWATID